MAMAAAGVTIYRDEAQRLELTAFINQIIGARIDADYRECCISIVAACT